MLQVNIFVLFSEKEVASHTYPICKFAIHELYKTDDTNRYDISLMETCDDIPFSPNIGPACMPNKRYDLVGKTVKVLGKKIYKIESLIVGTKTS